jgi:hypothetical protein
MLFTHSWDRAISTLVKVLCPRFKTCKEKRKRKRKTPTNYDKTLSCGHLGARISLKNNARFKET